VKDYFNFLVGSVLRGGIEQAQHTGVDKIIEIHMHRQILMDSYRDGLQQRKVSEHNPIPDHIRDLFPFTDRHTRSLHFFLFIPVT